MQVLSQHSFADTFERLKTDVLSHGLTIFVTVNFSEDAEKAGLKMNPTRMLIFGNPKAGTPLMIATPTIAIDFPLKVVVFQDENGRTWLLCNSPQYLKERYNVPEELMKNISGIVPIMESAAK